MFVFEEPGFPRIEPVELCVVKILEPMHIHVEFYYSDQSRKHLGT